MTEAAENTARGMVAERDRGRGSDGDQKAGSFVLRREEPPRREPVP
jgi:hypothetical protein